MKTIGYLRVSRIDQDVEKNKADILRFANDRKLGNVEWVEEHVSGMKHWRQRELGKVLETLQPGDTLITPEFSRLARSTLQILEIVHECKQREIDVHVLKGNWTMNGNLDSKVVLLVFSLAAEVERDLISARTKEALAARKAAGMKLGRPRGPGKSKLDKVKPEIEALLRTGSSQMYIAQRYGCSRVCLSNFIRSRGIEIAPSVQASMAIGGQA